MTGLDLGNIQRLFDRPAPTGGDPDVITGGGPWQPRNLPAKAKKADIIWNRLKPCCGEVLEGESCDCAELAAQLEQANRRPILLDYRRAA